MNSTCDPFLKTIPSDFMDEKVSTGTSIMAVQYDGGVVIAADSRTTMGAYIAHRFQNKLEFLSDNIMACRSGSAADTQAICDIVRYRLSMLSMELGEPVSVKTAANDLKQICYNYRDSLQVGMIVAGYDRKKGGQVFSIPLGGMLSQEKFCVGGSGSTYIFGYIDSNFKPNMSEEECIEFTRKGLSLAMWRDGSSGGVIRMAVINENGIKRYLFRGEDQVHQYYN